MNHRMKTDIEFDSKQMKDVGGKQKSHEMKKNGGSSISRNNCPVIEESHSFPSLDQSSISLDSMSLDLNESHETDPTSMNLGNLSFAADDEHVENAVTRVDHRNRPAFDDSVMSVDPFYSFSAEELQSKVQRSPTRCTCDDFLSLSIGWIASRLFPPSWTVSNDGDDFSNSAK